MDKSGQRILFVTGKLATKALEAIVVPLGQQLSFQPNIFTAKISVAALMTTEWLKSKLVLTESIDRVILPGGIQGDLQCLVERFPSASFEKGPSDLFDLPSYFQHPPEENADGDYDIEIVAEINHAKRLSTVEILHRAQRYVMAGADVVDLGCTPGDPWSQVGDVVAMLRDQGVRVSIDSFDETELALAVKGGAELVFSVNASNLDWAMDGPAEVVVIPTDPRHPGWLDDLLSSSDRLERAGIKHRLDPILEPIGFGFAASLSRYLKLRACQPDRAIIMGVGNLTEMTEVDSAGVNALLIGFCQELSIRSVLTTEVIPWASSCVAEIDIARRMIKRAIDRHGLPKHIDDRLVMLKDTRAVERGDAELRRLQAEIKDPNFRLFAERGAIHAMNHELFESGHDAFALFSKLDVSDPSHAFYLGWEMMKATLALQLGKRYNQDQALPFGLLTQQEVSHRSRHSKVPKDDC